MANSWARVKTKTKMCLFPYAARKIFCYPCMLMQKVGRTLLGSQAISSKRNKDDDTNRVNGDPSRGLALQVSRMRDKVVQVCRSDRMLRTRGYALVHIQWIGLLQRPFVPAEALPTLPITVSLADSRAFQKIISS